MQNCQFPKLVGCKEHIQGECVHYSGVAIPTFGINNGDSFNTVVIKLSESIGMGSIITADNGLNVFGGNTARLGGVLIEPTTITFNETFTLTFNDSVSESFLTFTGDNGSGASFYSEVGFLGTTKKSLLYDYNGLVFSDVDEATDLLTVTNNLTAISTVLAGPSFSVLSTGQIRFNNYVGVLFDAAPVKFLGVDASGNVIKTSSGGAVTGTI